MNTWMPLLLAPGLPSSWWFLSFIPTSWESVCLPWSWHGSSMFLSSRLFSEWLALGVASPFKHNPTYFQIRVCLYGHHQEIIAPSQQLKRCAHIFLSGKSRVSFRSFQWDLLVACLDKLPCLKWYMVQLYLYGCVLVVA